MRPENNRRITYMQPAFALAIGTAIMLAVVSISAQATVFIGGLNSPSKMITAGGSSLLVAEAGMTTAANSGRISLVNRVTGARQTLIDGLPSATSLSGGAPDASGPSGLKLNGQKLYLTIGAGDTSIPVTGGTILNPAPSSPLLDSVLELTLPVDYETLASSFSLSNANQATLNGGGQVTLNNGEGKQLIVRLVANLPNFVAEPRPALPENIREANCYGVEISGDSLYVIDASFNLLYRVNIATGVSETFAVFAIRPNPTPVGPPFIEPVPDSIRLVGGNLVISLLTGFPFVQGLSEVRTVNLATGTQAVLISGLTSALEVIPFETANNAFLVLEFSSNQLAQAPGRLKLFTSPAANPIILADGLITPTSVVRVAPTGTTYITEKATGRIMRLAGPSAAGVSISGRVVSSDGRGLRNAIITITDMQGVSRTAITSSFGYYTFSDAQAGGSYVITVSAKRFRFASRIIEAFDDLTNVDFVGQE